MRLLIHSEPTAAENLAVEEAILRASLERKVDDTIRFWINPPCVIIGRFQVAELNCNLNFCLKNNIEVIRRESSGGAVYQDLGNWNHSLFFQDLEKYSIRKGNLFSTLSSFLVQSLNNLGIPASFSPPNDVTLNNRKISGSAQYELYTAFLHHATLLVSTDLNQLSQSLIVPEIKMKDKGVEKISERVTTIFNEGYSISAITDFAQEYATVLSDALGIEVKEGKLSKYEKKLAKQLYKEKYSSKEWNLDLIPVDNIKWINYKFPLGLLQMGLEIDKKNGIIKNVLITGDLSIRNFEPFLQLEKFLINKPLERKILLEQLKKANLKEFSVEPEILLKLILEKCGTNKN